MYECGGVAPTFINDINDGEVIGVNKNRFIGTFMYLQKCSDYDRIDFEKLLWIFDRIFLKICKNLLGHVAENHLWL